MKEKEEEVERIAVIVFNVFAPPFPLSFSHSLAVSFPSRQCF